MHVNIHQSERTKSRFNDFTQCYGGVFRNVASICKVDFLTAAAASAINRLTRISLAEREQLKTTSDVISYRTRVFDALRVVLISRVSIFLLRWMRESRHWRGS
jgi:hypothetical protein